MNSWLNKFCPGFMSLPRKPHPFGNEYHSIVNGDRGKPIMWQIRIVEDKDWPRKSDGTFAFQTKWEKKGFTNTVELLMDITELIHHTGKVTGDSGFCVALGVTTLHQHDVHGQFLIKKHSYWPKHIPGDYIDAYMMTKQLGAMETFVQDLGGLRFFVHCTHNADYFTKIMPTHRVQEEIQDHLTWHFVNGEWKTFKYAKLFSRHNHAKHWVDNVNNCCHDPMGLEKVWQTKRWPIYFPIVHGGGELCAG
jgi:hypothetical protein